MAEIVDKYILDTKEAQANLAALVTSSSNAFDKFKAQAISYENQLKKTAATAGQAGQTLTKQYNGLNLAISQFAREAPNAAQSAEIFFRSIGNNFGQLQDAINRLREQNVQLAAQGLKTQSILKQVAISIVSVNSAINLGVLILVMYGKEIGNLITSLFKSKDAFNAAKESFNSLNDALQDKAISKAISEIEKMKLSIDLAQKGFLNKEVVLLKYNETIGKSVGLAKNLNEAEELLIKNASAYIAIQVNKTAAQLSLNKAADNAVQIQQKLLERDKSIAEQRKALDREEANQIANINRGSFKISEEAVAEQTLEIRERFRKKRLELTDKGINEEIVALENGYQEQLKIARRFEVNALKIAQGSGIDPDPDGTKALEKEKERLKKLSEAKLKSIRETADKELALNQKIADEQIPGGGLNVRLREDEEYAQRIKNRLKLVEDRVEQEKKHEKDKDKYISDLADEAYKELVEGAKKEADLNDKKNKKRIADEKEVNDRLREIGENTINEIFNLRSNIEQAYTDQRIQKLEEERDKELENDKLTAEQRASIQKEFDQKRSEILNKNARVQRQIDLSQILVNTAIAVIKALATATNPAQGQILAALAAAEGAIQYGFAQSQPLPQFALGTDRVTGGIRGKDSVHALLMPDEAVIKAGENMRHPGLAKAWNDGRLNEFLAMKYIEPALEEISRKEASRINNTFINNNKSSMTDKRIVKSMNENTAVNKMMLKQMLKGQFATPTNKRLWG